MITGLENSDYPILFYLNRIGKENQWFPRDLAGGLAGLELCGFPYGIATIATMEYPHNAKPHS